MIKNIDFPFPVLVTKEGRWFVAECRLLSIATQGKTEKEVRENIKDLIKEYFSDPDVPKIRLKELGFSSFTYVSAPVPRKFLYGETQTTLSK